MALAGKVQMEPKSPIRIPHDLLSREALRTVIEELVTRDGTELTDAVDKIEQVHLLLELGEVELWFDKETRSCNLMAC